MSNYVGKSPISLEQGIETFKKCVKNLENYYKDPGEVTYKKYEDVFTEYVRSLENQMLYATTNVGSKKPGGYGADLNKFFVMTTGNPRPSDPRPPKDLKYTEVVKDIIAYFEGCGYTDIDIPTAQICKYENGIPSNFKPWDDAWGLPFHEPNKPGEMGSKPMFTLPEGYQLYNMNSSMGSFSMTVMK